MNFLTKLRDYFLEDGHYLNVIEKYALLFVVIFCFFRIPIYYIPTTLLTEEAEASDIITEHWLEKLNDGNVLEITMTNMRNYFNGECYAKQTFTKIDPRSKKPRTYTYWTKYCTGTNGFIYDFRLVNEDGKKLTLYTLTTPDGFIETLRDDHWAFGLSINKPLKYFARY